MATVFQETMERYAAWQGDPEGEAPAYPVYNGARVVGLVDLFPRFFGQLVVFPRDPGGLGEDVSMEDLPIHVQSSVGLVVNTFRRRMRQLFEVRAIRHEEGYAVPDHPHAVVFPAARGEGVGLYQPSALGELGPDYFTGMQAMLTPPVEETRRLDQEIELNYTLLDPT